MKPGRIGWPGVFLASLLVAAGAGCSAGGPETPEPAARTIRVVSGNYQQGGLGAPLAEPVVFQVRDPGGAPLPGALVRFRVVAGGGQVGASEAVCDSQGLAGATWTAGDGLDPLLRAESQDENSRICTAYAYANTDLRLETGWISGVTFYRNFSEPVDHDGRVFESNAILTFSDSSSEELKVLFSKSAEEGLREVMASLTVASPAELGISGSDTDTKIKIYAKRRPPYDTGTWIGARNPAIMFDAIDCQRLSPDLAANHRYVRRGLKHEITHMVQLLIVGPSNVVGSWPPCWFNEGLAEHESAGVSSCPAPITTVAMLDAWFADPNHSRHPLEIQDFEDIPANQGCQYYAVFGLVVDFLLDPQGGGRTGADVKALLLELAQSHDFPGAFANHMGVSVAYLHDNLRDLLAAWLEGRDGD
jgi:hypothetical protein